MWVAMDEPLLVSGFRALYTHTWAKSFTTPLIPTIPPLRTQQQQQQHQRQQHKTYTILTYTHITKFYNLLASH